MSLNVALLFIVTLNILNTTIESSYELFCLLAFSYSQKDTLDVFYTIAVLKHFAIFNVKKRAIVSIINKTSK